MVVTDQIIIINQKYTSGREMAGVGVGQLRGGVDVQGQASGAVILLQNIIFYPLFCYHNKNTAF